MAVVSDDAAERALQELHEKFGKAPHIEDSRLTIPSGSATLDTALGGGLPRGRIVEVYGPDSVGKTTLALHAIAENQKLGGICVFIDAEKALDPRHAEAHGVVMENLLVSMPDCGETALDTADLLARTGAIDLVVVDSVAALTPRSELEGEIGGMYPGAHARLMSQGMRKLSEAATASGATFLFVNQIREVVGRGLETTTGGNALKFYSSTRLGLRRLGSIVKNYEPVGIRIGVYVSKNTLFAPSLDLTLELRYDGTLS